MSTMVRSAPSRHRLTATEYRRMGEVGILRPDARVELIEGEIIDMAPIGSRHSGTVEQLAHLLRRACGERAMVRTQQPVSLDDHSEPEPDIVVVTPRADFYKRHHPRAPDIILLIEVSEASLAYDREVKVPLYARHSVREAWIVDLAQRRIELYANPHAGVYARVETVGAQISAGGLPGLTLDVASLFDA